MFLNNKTIKMSNYIMFIFLLGLAINIIEANSLPKTQKEKLAKRFLKSQNCAKSNSLTKKLTKSDFLRNIKSQLYITGQSGKSALLNLKIKNKPIIYSMGLHKNEFVLMSKNDYKILSVLKDNKSILKGNSIMANTLKVKGEVKYNNVPQWRLARHDSFYKNNTSLNWSYEKTTECNDHKILGGYCQLTNQELVKEYKNLPPHTMVRIEAYFHFLGKWESHTGYLKIDHRNSINKNEKYVWSQRCKNMKSPLLNVKLCGTKNVCKLGVPINSTIYHRGKNLKLIFGSTLDGQSCEQSYGISEVKIYIR
jgi:hypothetical protein